MTKKTIRELRAASNQMILAAQDELDNWRQDENGVDEFLGTGGCCGLIADAMSHTLSCLGFDIARLSTDFDGGHEFLVANTADGVFSVDIPARVYETGYGYVWTKRDGVVLTEEDVVLDRVADPMTQEEFAAAYLDEGLSPSWD